MLEANPRQNLYILPTTNGTASLRRVRARACVCVSRDGRVQMLITTPQKNEKAPAYWDALRVAKMCRAVI